MPRIRRMTSRNRLRRNRNNNSRRRQATSPVREPPRQEPQSEELPREEPQSEELPREEPQRQEPPSEEPPRETINWNADIANNDPRLGEGFPFEGFLADFLEQNRDKECNFLLGIGTSGSNNPKEIIEFIHDDRHENQRFFILLIDPYYRTVSGNYGRESSLRPFLDRDYSRGGPPQIGEENQYVKATHPNGNIVYLWNYSVPSEHRLTEFTDEINQINEIKDDPNGAYEYGKQCGIETLSQNIRQFYLRLYSILRKPEFKNIYVYNCGYWNNPSGFITRDPSRFYRGPRFSTQHPIRFLEPREASPGTTYWNANAYFQHYCEILYILSKLDKPVYILEPTNQQSSNGIFILEKIRVYERINTNTRGGRRRKNRITTRKKLNY